MSRYSDTERRTFIERRILALAFFFFFYPIYPMEPALASLPPKYKLLGNKQVRFEGKREKVQLLSKRGGAYLQIYLVYATIRSKRYVDPKLHSKLPSLNKFYRYNTYILLKKKGGYLPYNHSIALNISRKYRVNFKVLNYPPPRSRILRTKN